MEGMFQLVGNGSVAKEAVAELLKWQVANPNSEPKAGIQSLGLKTLTQGELEQIIDRHIAKNKRLVDEKGEASFSSIMGSVMSEVRGRTDPKVVTDTLKKKLTIAAAH
jgi:glutamyl-tRNA(Gln) amidotransferase subunit E